MITITRGQWFPLTIGNIRYGGAAFDLQGATDVSASLVSTLGVRSALSFEITAYNELSAVCDGTLSAGRYSIEVSCKGADGKSYRMMSPEAIIEVSSSTTPSVGSTSVRVSGDEWELTADVEMHEAQARTYMSLLEEAENARATAENERATAENARATAENERAQSEQSRESAETERASAERARVTAETDRVNAETQRETAFSSAKEACETATSNAAAAADKANTATTNAHSAERGRVEAENGRVEAEQGRVEAEQGRAAAETAREQGFTEKAAHLEELLQYIKDNHLETDVKLAEAIKNTITGTDEFVYLDANDGNVKSMPNTNQLRQNVAAVYYAGKRSIKPGENCMLSDGNNLILNVDLSGWDFEAATNMSQFFNYLSALRTLTLPDNMTLANVTNMYACFYNCTSLHTLDTSKCTLANVTNMYACFRGCTSLQTLDTSKWTLANVTDMSFCFYTDGSLRFIDTSKWTLANVTNMYACFQGCTSLHTLDTSKWTLANVTNMDGCFYNCTSLQTLDTSKWTLANVTNMNLCFYNCVGFLELDLSSCNITKCINWNNWIGACKNLETLRIGLIDFSLCGAVDFLCDTNIRELTGTLRGIKNNFTAKSNRMTRDSCMVVINGLETVTEAKTLTLGANNKPVSLGGKGNDPISDADLKIATDKGWTVAFA